MISRSEIGKVISCHIDSNDPETFVIGVLLYLDDKWFLMADISSYGESNGFALYQRDDIVIVETENEYIDKINFLIQYNRATWPAIKIENDNLLIGVLELCHISGEIVGIETYASGFRDINGIVEKKDENVVIINQVNEYGTHDGTCWLDVSSITRIYFYDKESTYLNILRGTRE